MPTTVLSDTFTGADSTALTAHPMNVGGGWIAAVGTFIITSNKATPNSNNDDDEVVADAGFSDVTLTCDVVPTNNGSLWENDPDLVLRWRTPADCWIIHVTVPGAVIQLVEVTAGVSTVRAFNSFLFVNGTTYTITAVCSGPSITVSVNSMVQLTYGAATSNQTATKFGLRTGKAGAVSTKCTWDNFLVTVPQLLGATAGAQPLVFPGPTSGPWQFRGVPLVRTPPTPPAPPAVSPYQTGLLPGFGAPWFNLNVRPARGVIVAPQIPPAPPTPTPGRKTLTPRVPSDADEGRRRRFTEHVASIIDSLVRQGFLIQKGYEWSLNVTAGPAPPLTAAQIAALFLPAFGFRPLVTGDLPSAVSGSFTNPVLTVVNGLITAASTGIYSAVTAFNAADQTIPTNTTTFLSFNSQYEDTDGYHSTVTNTGRLTVPAGKPGRYFIWAVTRWATNSVGVRQSVLIKNRNNTLAPRTEQANTVSNADMWTATVARLQVGDFVEQAVVQTTGANLLVNYVPTFTPNFGMFKIGD